MSVWLRAITVVLVALIAACTDERSRFAGAAKEAAAEKPATAPPNEPPAEPPALPPAGA